MHSSQSSSYLPNETTLAVTEYNDDWYATTYGSLSGYVLKQYVQSLNQEADSILTGTVTGGGLNLRQKASTSTERLILIPNETELEVVDYDTASDWYRTSYGGYAGYVMKQFVEIPGPLPETEWLYGQVTSSSLNVRKQPSLSAPLWNYPWPLNRIALVKPAVDGWYETLYRGDPAYVSAQYIDLLDEPVPDSIVDRMLFMAIPELGRTNSQKLPVITPPAPVRKCAIPMMLSSGSKVCSSTRRPATIIPMNTAQTAR